MHLKSLTPLNCQPKEIIQNTSTYAAGLPNAIWMEMNELCADTPNSLLKAPSGPNLIKPEQHIPLIREFVYTKIRLSSDCSCAPAPKWRYPQTALVCSWFVCNLEHAAT
jgi:hypothetical protein